MYKRDSLIFQEGDLNRKEVVDDYMKATLVQFFIKNKVTYGMFYEKHRAYMLREGKPFHSIPSDRNNLLRTLLKKNRLTYSMFEDIMKNIFNYNLIGMSLTFRDIDNKLHLISVERRSF